MRIPREEPRKKTLDKFPLYPIVSMYGMFTYIWFKFMVNVGEYTIHGSYGYWLVNKDPYIMVYYNSYIIWVGFHPLYQTTNQGFVHCSRGVLKQLFVHDFQFIGFQQSKENIGEERCFKRWLQDDGTFSGVNELLNFQGVVWYLKYCLELQTTIFVDGCLVKQPFFHVKIWNHPIETTIKNYLFQVPGVCDGIHV